MFNIDEKIFELKRNTELTIDQLLKLKELELMEEILFELRYRNEYEN